MILKWTLTRWTYFSRKFLWAKTFRSDSARCLLWGRHFCFVTGSHNSTSAKRLQSILQQTGSCWTEARMEIWVWCHPARKPLCCRRGIIRGGGSGGDAGENDVFKVGEGKFPRLIRKMMLILRKLLKSGPFEENESYSEGRSYSAALFTALCCPSTSYTESLKAWRATYLLPCLATFFWNLTHPSCQPPIDSIFNLKFQRIL